jgi:hypothetical protein
MTETREDIIQKLFLQQNVQFEISTLETATIWLSNTTLGFHAKEKVMKDLEIVLFGRDYQKDLLELPLSYRESKDMASVLHSYMSCKNAAIIQVSFAYALYYSLLEQWDFATLTEENNVSLALF